MDLVALVPDKAIETVLDNLLRRHQSLRIRNISADIFVHPARDPGCRRHAAAFLQPMVAQYDRALVLFDHEGCGDDDQARTAVERSVIDSLERNGWDGRAGAVVIDPEVDVWVWSDSPHVASALGWTGTMDELHEELRTHGFLAAGALKPHRPKEAVAHLLRQARIPFSASIYGNLAQRVSVQQCQDPAFVALTTLLRTWFPPS